MSISCRLSTRTSFSIDLSLLPPTNFWNYLIVDISKASCNSCTLRSETFARSQTETYDWPWFRFLHVIIPLTLKFVEFATGFSTCLECVSITLAFFGIHSVHPLSLSHAVFFRDGRNTSWHKTSNHPVYSFCGLTWFLSETINFVLNFTQFCAHNYSNILMNAYIVMRDWASWLR